jgi:hypothetical protein
VWLAEAIDYLNVRGDALMDLADVLRPPAASGTRSPPSSVPCASSRFARAVTSGGQWP